MKKEITAGIIGGAGYTGGEAIRLLINHPHVELKFVHSRSNAGNLISEVHADLISETDLTFTDSLQDVDIIFLCLGHGESKKFVQENSIPGSIKIIDLSHDFRLGNSINSRQFVYGLPELNKELIKKSKNIANPGCFATAIALGLLPLAKLGLLKEVYTTGITGSTGAGQKLQDSTHFTWRANNISAYKTLTHQHLKEITQSVKQLQPDFSCMINFVPWRGDFTRGIFVSSMITTDKSLDELNSIFWEFYQDHPFTSVANHTLDLKQVVKYEQVHCQPGERRQ